MSEGRRDRIERYAQRLWRRWYRAAVYAQTTSVVDAALRFRLNDAVEVRKALRDFGSRDGLAYMLRRARKAARYRLAHEFEDVVVRMARSMPVAGRNILAEAVRRSGYIVGPSTVRRVLIRRGVWEPTGGEGSGRQR